MHQTIRAHFVKFRHVTDLTMASRMLHSGENDLQEALNVWKTRYFGHCNSQPHHMHVHLASILSNIPTSPHIYCTDNIIYAFNRLPDSFRSHVMQFFEPEAKDTRSYVERLLTGDVPDIEIDENDINFFYPPPPPPPGFYRKG